jgi:hypothetical protein
MTRLLSTCLFFLNLPALFERVLRQKRQAGFQRPRRRA